MRAKPVAVVIALALACPASARPSPPTAAQLARLRLGDSFTLTYQVTVRDVRPTALRDKDAAQQRAGVANEEAAGRIAGSMRGYFEKQALELAQTRAPERFTITLSARDGKLLYLSNRSASDQKAGTESPILLDGDTEYEVNGRMSAMINNDAWRSAPVYRGENVARLAFCPLPGVGLPGVDMIQNPVRVQATTSGVRFTGLVPRFNLVGDPPYRPGEVQAVLFQGRLRVVSLAVGPRAAPEQAWQISAFRLMQGHWIATAMRMTTYEAGTPSSEARYHLTEARTEALESSAFDMGAYLSKGATVFDDSTGSSISFPYDPQGRTLKEQGEAARKKESEKDARTP